MFTLQCKISFEQVENVERDLKSGKFVKKEKWESVEKKSETSAKHIKGKYIHQGKAKSEWDFPYFVVDI